jgi:hypothetical protein
MRVGVSVHMRVCACVYVCVCVCVHAWTHLQHMKVTPTTGIIGATTEKDMTIRKTSIVMPTS